MENLNGAELPSEREKETCEGLPFMESPFQMLREVFLSELCSTIESIFNFPSRAETSCDSQLDFQYNSFIPLASEMLR